jgi:RHS repeat-associated protein
LDKETGNCYFRERYYSPETGRFISEDPISFYGGDINLYRYCWDNPVNYIDPLGLFDIYGFPSSSVSGFFEDMKLGIKWTLGAELTGHYTRNKLNNFVTLTEAKSNPMYWYQHDWSTGKFHGAGNLKFTSDACAYGKYENVYSPSGSQVLDPRYMATYNYGNNAFTGCALTIMYHNTFS